MPIKSLRIAKLERERTIILFWVASFFGLFTYYELGRRQSINERKEEERRSYVDHELRDLRQTTLEATARAAGAAEAAKAQRERSETRWTRGNMVWGGVVALLTLVVTVLAYRLIA